MIKVLGLAGRLLLELGFIEFFDFPLNRFTLQPTCRYFVCFRDETMANVPNKKLKQGIIQNGILESYFNI